MAYTLRMPASTVGRPVVEGFVQQVAELGGLEPEEAAALSAACGDVLAFLAQSPEETELEWTCQGTPAFALAQVCLPAHPRTWQALQACQLSGVLRESTRERLLPAAGLKPGQTSLMRAARRADRVQLAARDGRVSLSLLKSHTYPALSEREFTLPAPQECVRVCAPTLGGLEELCQHLPAGHFPEWMAHPERILDLLELHEAGGGLALGEQGDCLGGIFWRPSLPVVEAFGPYLLGEQPAQVAECLTDFCLSSLARSRARGLMIRYTGEQLPKHDFEELVEGEYFRMLGEDPGGLAWAPEGLEDWLRQEYRRLALAREVRTAPVTTPASPNSAFSTEVLADRQRFTLYPIQPGRDLAENLARYVDAGREAGMTALIVGLDLGEPWQAALGPELQRQGFRPRMVRPLGGTSLDLLIFQHEQP